jgi:hypothetical protein
MQLCTMGQIWPGPTLKWPAHGLAFTVWLDYGAEGPALPRFYPSPMGQPAELEPNWGSRVGANPLLWCAHADHRWRPTDFGMPAVRRGGEDSMGTRWRSDPGFGLRGERGSPGDTLHGGGNSKMGAGGGSSDQRLRHPTARSGSCVALPHSLGRCAWGWTAAGGTDRRRGAFPSRGGRCRHLGEA